MGRPRRTVVRSAVGCPQCLAVVGAPCIGNGGQERVSNHQSRTTAYEATLEPVPDPVAAVGPCSDDRLHELQSMPYDEYLLTPEWRARRAEAIDRAGGMCQLCCSPRRLHAHHRTYVRRGHEHPADLTVLCEECHDLFHEHRQLQNFGGNVSYGAYVQACIDERTAALSGRTDQDFARVKRANDDFPDYPEQVVLDALRELQYPQRPVTFSEVRAVLKQRVSSAEKRAYLTEEAA